MVHVVVEHAAPAAGHSRGTAPLPQVQYEGYEPSPYDSEIRAELEHPGALVCKQISDAFIH